MKRKRRAQFKLQSLYIKQGEKRTEKRCVPDEPSLHEGDTAQVHGADAPCTPERRGCAPNSRMVSYLHLRLDHFGRAVQHQLGNASQGCRAEKGWGDDEQSPRNDLAWA